MSRPAAKRAARAGGTAPGKGAAGKATSAKAVSVRGVASGGTGRGATGGATRRTASSVAATRVPAGGAGTSSRGTSAVRNRAGAGTAIQRCVREELERYFALLDGEPPSDLYRLVMQQVEAALIEAVLRECNGNRSRAAVWLGISRGTLRGKLADLDPD